MYVGSFFCWNELSLTTYHYHLFLHPLVMAAFELTINYYHGFADAKKLFRSSNFMFCLEFLEANIPPPSFFGTDTMVWILPTLKGMFLLENPRPRGMDKIRKTDEKIRILSRVNHIPTWRGFFASKKIIGRGKSRKIGIISRKRDHWISAEVLIYQYFN